MFLIFLATVSLQLPAAAAPPADLYSGYREMYDLNFSGAHEIFTKWKGEHPEDPMGPVSNAAAYLFSELERLRVLDSELFVDDDRFRGRKRLTPDASLKREFEEELARGRQLATRTIAQTPGEQNASLAEILADGLDADYLALIERRYLASLSIVKQGRTRAQQLLTAHPDNYDAYLAIGVENYLLSLKAAPLRWMLELSGAQTDKAEGIAKLHLVADKGHLLQPYARMLLAVAALRDNDRNRAKQLLEGLLHDFPHNRLYAAELARLKKPD